MTDIKIVTEEKEEQRPADVNDLKETLRAADEYKKLKEENDKLEAEYLRQQELKAKITYGGRAAAGQPVKSPEDLAKEEAAEILKAFQTD